jgi:hypothetical protein
VSGAQAGLLNLNNVVNLNPCNGNALSQAFLPWADPSWYELAPGGTFGDSSWALNGGAQIVPGGEPFGATGSPSTSSLSMPAGSTATSPQTCVDAAYPSIRFFIAGTGTVGVSVIYDGTVIPAGTATALGDWAPTPVEITGSALWGLLSGGSAQVSIQLTALSGNPQVDDVFIDPWNRW